MTDLENTEIELVAAAEGEIDLPYGSDYWQKWLEDWKRLHPEGVVISS